MRYVVWTIRLLVFVAVLFFAFKNVTPVDVVFYDAVRISQVPLIVVMLLAFVLGAVLGALLMLPGRWKRWRESGRLRRDLHRSNGSKPEPQGTTLSGVTAQTDISPL